MDRHVIKGRGPNRGKYLCHARRAPQEKPTSDGYVWLPDQRKAARWPDPRYSGWNCDAGRARAHNGYFVKLVAPKTIVARVPALRSFIEGHAKGVPNKPRCHWFSADFDPDCGTFCRDCAEKFVDEQYAKDPKHFDEMYGECETAEERYDAAIDGGFDIEHDSTPRCATCDVPLRGSLTDYGADEEVSALTDYGGPSFDDAHGWDQLNDAVANFADDDPRWRRIAHVVDVAAAAELKHQAKQAALAVSPGMPEARAAFMALLAARAKQKAPEPSYRRWDELLAWENLSLAERDGRPAQERELVREAKRFADALGWPARWCCGSFCIIAPYGDYHFSFVVMIEQWRLWQPAPFNEGRAFGRQPRKPYRDANPYDKRGGDYNTPMTIEAKQWDAGYILGSHERVPQTTKARRAGRRQPRRTA